MKGNKTGSGFDKHPENINKKGRSKKIYTILKEKGYSSDDIKTAFGELSFYTEMEIEQIHDDIKKPIIVRIIAKMFYMALEDGDWSKIKEMIDHMIGKPKQEIDQNITENQKVEIVNLNAGEYDIDENGNVTKK